MDLKKREPALASAPAVFVNLGHGHTGFLTGALMVGALVLAVLWLVPLVARTVAEATQIPLAVPAMLAVFALIVGRAMAQHGLDLRWRFAGRVIK